METDLSLTAEVPPLDPEYSANDDQPQGAFLLPERIEEQVKRGLLLYEPNELVNIRVLLNNGRMVSQFSRDKSNLTRFVANIDNDQEIKAIFVQLQVLNLANHRDIPKGSGVKREHVSHYRWFVIDIDTLRPDKASTNATEEEKEHSLTVARAVTMHLQSIGWPEPILCDSGNGWHLVWKIALSNTQEHYQMFESCLLASAAKFDNEHAEIDCSLAEPEQIIKLWGTMVRKGKNTPLRPWRRSTVVTIPGSVEVVPLALLDQLASEAPARNPRTTAKKRGYPQLDDDFDPEHFFEWCQENLPREYQQFFCRDSEADHQDAGGYHYVMDGCFWAERKHSGDRKKTEFILGRTFGVKCFSDDCVGVHIGDILRKVTKLAGKPYPGRIWKQDDSIFDGVDLVEDDDELTDEASEDESVGSTKQSRIIADAYTLATLINVTTPNAAVDNPGVEDGNLLPISERLVKASGEGNPVESESGADPLAFPEEAMYGKLGEMAMATNTPRGLAYPAVIGTFSVVPEMVEMAGTRINAYVILLAPPGGGKNVAIKRALAMVNLPSEWYRKAAPVSDRGVMSLVGHRTEKKRGAEKAVIPGPRKLLLVTNEAANVLKKANIKNSSLGATLCDLWDENQYTAADRNGEQSCDCRLSWLGGLPIKRDHPEEFGEYFGRETGRGLLSRTILGFSDVKFNYRDWTPPNLWSNDDEGNLDEIGFQHPSAVRFSDDCQRMLDEWEPNDEEQEGRLKYIAKKVALLTASANDDEEVGVECMKAAIEFAKWQGRLREVFKIGVAAEFSLEAQFAEALIGALEQKGGNQKYIAWRRLAHDRKWVERFGPRVVNTTVENLIKSGTVEPQLIVKKDENGKPQAETNTNKIKLRDWKKQ